MSLISMPIFFKPLMIFVVAVFVWFCASAIVFAVFVTPKEIYAVSGATVLVPVPSTLKRFCLVVWIELTVNGNGGANLAYNQRKKKIKRTVKNGIRSSLNILFI